MGLFPNRKMSQSDLVDVIVDIMQKQMGDTEIILEKEPPAEAASSAARADGIYDSVDEAVAAAEQAFYALEKMTIADRKRILKSIKDKISLNIERLSRMELEETGYGRLEHKVAKNQLVLDKTPGMEDLQPEVISGDDGLTLIERRPYGIAGCIMPSTGPSSTTVHNSLCMIAAGNSAVLSPHPGGIQTTLEATRLINEAIAEAGGPAGLICCTRQVTLENTKAIMTHPKIDLLLGTGGPAIVKEILSSGKKGICAGPGNPPVLVDHTADIPLAARDIVDGCFFENCIQCIGEKECFVVDCVADLLIAEMQQNGAYLIRDPEDIERLTQLVTVDGQPNKAYIGKDAAVILKAAGLPVTGDPKIIIYEVPADHITVMEEYLMPLLPIVRVCNVDEGIDLAVKAEGRRRHSAMIHSRDVHNLSQYAKRLQTTILVKNGPSYAGVGLGGEGHVSVSIAGPTGEGLTTPRSFTRPERCVMCGSFDLRGAIV